MSDTAISYVGDGRTRAFPAPFPIFDGSDVQVRVGETVQTTGFKVVGGLNGGMVTFAAPPAAGVVVDLRRLLDVAKPSPFDGGTLNASLIGQEFHRLTAAIGQVADDVARTVARSPLSSSTADLTLPEPVPLRALIWNADGSGLTNSGTDLEALGRQVAVQVEEAKKLAALSATSAAAASRAEETARAVEAEIRTAAEAATGTIADAADISMVEARKAASLVGSIADPAAAFRKLKLIGLW